MPSLTCIVCPIGCGLTVEVLSPDAVSQETVAVSGNRCPRGAVYAQEEIRAPKRVVTATCAIDGPGLKVPDCRRVPVKTSLPCSKEKIPALLKDLYALRVSLPVKSGDVVLAGWQGTGIDLIAVRTLGAEL